MGQLSKFKDEHKLMLLRSGYLCLWSAILAIDHMQQQAAIQTAALRLPIVSGSAACLVLLIAYWDYTLADGSQHTE